MRKIIRRLQSTPSIFGDFIQDLVLLRLQIRAAAVHPLMVQFAVHEEKSIVFIMKIQLLSS